eukprot:3811449-Pyramimonas_sp.AAC.1
MDIFPSSFHSDTAEILAAAWALAWIAQAQLGHIPVALRLDSMRTLGVLMGAQTYEVANSGLTFLRALVQFLSASCTID